MNLDFSAEEEAFRLEARAFLQESYPDELRGKSLPQCARETLLSWHRVLHRKGWIAPAWPPEYGGCGWRPLQRALWAQELARAQALLPAPFGIDMLGPLLLTFGTDAQKKTFLPPILSGDHWWCQGFSESEAGSDLAALSSGAVRTGDVYVVSGHKIWTTMAHVANWIFCLVRTDPQAEKKQAGLSFLLIDMESPGVTVRPIIGIDGLHEVNQVFFDEVEVPLRNRLGDENDGWRLAKFLLANERFGLSEIPAIIHALPRIRQQISSDDSPVHARLAARLAELEIEALALEITEWRALTAQNEKDAALSSFLKVRGTELQQKVTTLALDMASHEGLCLAQDASSAVQRHLNARKLSIYGGTNEIQRNIIAKTLLGF